MVGAASTLRRGYHGQSLMASGIGEAIVKRHKWQRLAHLALQVKAAGQLHRVAGPQAMANEEGAGIRGNLRRELDDDQRGEIVASDASARSRSSMLNAPSLARRTNAEATSTSERRLAVAGAA
jgi:hypothetical protein